jgi:hypothetical protein
VPIDGPRDVGTDPEQGWCCHAADCGARGTIYDLASVLDGGPWGAALRGDAFARARARVSTTLGVSGRLRGRGGALAD